MINKLLKFSTIFLVILGISFSNIPFYAITGLIDSYVKTIGVVDKIWLVQQDGDSNIVDKFVSFRTIVRKLEIQKAQAAITYQTPGALAYSASGGTSVSPAYPASIVANNLLVLIIGMKPSTANGGSVTTPSGWTPIISLTGAGGYGTTLGADTGNTNVFTYYKVAAGGESGSLAVTIATNGVSWAQMYRYTNASGSWSVAGTTGSDTAAGNVSIAFGVNPGVTVGDNILAAMVIPTDVTTPAQFSAEAFTQTGVTFGAVTEISEPDSGTGNDIGGFVVRASVSSGTASAVPTMTATAGGTNTNVRGPGVFIRIRENNTAPTLTVTQPDGTGDTVTVGDLYNITYDLADPDPLHAVTVDFYYDTDAVGLNGTAITGCVNQSEGTGATCSWNTTGMTPGAYYVYGRDVLDGIASEVSDYSPGVITINAPANNLTIGVTAGSKVTTVNSGDSLVYANTASCAASSTCAAFTLLVSNTSVTVSSIGITETGTVNASSDLSNLDLFYDTDGNYSNGVTGQYGSTVASFTSEVATTTGSLALTAGTTYYFYVRFNASSTTTYPKGGQTVNFQIATNNSVTFSSGSATISGAPVSLAGTTTILPKVSSVSYGAGLSDGVRSSETITISGYGFGVAPGGSRANCAGAVDTGCVRFLVGGAATVADSSVSSWSNISIGWTASSTIATLGGASSLEVVSGSQGTATDTTYYIYPRITSITNCASLPLNTAREYDVGDSACSNNLTDGAVIINGDHFDSAGSVMILGVTSTQAVVSGFCGGSAWTSTCISVQASSTIADNLYTGSATITRSSDLKEDVLTGFRILPRITSFTPSSASVGATVTINGNHFCQAGAASCPTVFDANNKITFNPSATSTVFTGWSNTSVTSTVPTGATTGNATTTSNGYNSNGKIFTVISPTPNDPSNLNQFKNSGLTQAIAIGGAVSSTPIYLTMTMEAPGISDGTLFPQIEYASTTTSFQCTASSTPCIGIITEGTGVAGPGPIDCSVLANNCAISISPPDDTHHWQARIRHNKSGINYYSNWVSFGGNPEISTDFQIDTTAPVITFTPTNTCAGGQSNPGTNNVTINWNFNPSDQADGQIEYSINSDLSGSVNYPSSPEASSTSHSITLSNLNSNTTYYYKVKSRDGIGNLGTKPTIPPDAGYCSFLTYTGVFQPAKTTQFYIIGATSTISGGNTASSSFSVYMPENSTSTQSVFLIINGVYDTTGSTPNKIEIWVNSEASKFYEIPIGSANKNAFKIIHKVNSINIDPGTNIFYIKPETNTSVSVFSAEVIVTYSYSP